MTSVNLPSDDVMSPPRLGESADKVRLGVSRGRDTLPPMRHSDLRALLDGEFGAAYAASVAKDHCLTTLGSRTVEQALADGIPPKQIWYAVCEDFSVPSARRFGVEKHSRPGG